MTAKAQMMVDIETLSSQPDGAIIAIGLAAFTLRDGVIDSTSCLIDPTLAPGHRDRNTLKWWAQQDPEVRNRMMGGSMQPWAACDKMAEFCRLHGGVLWAKSPQFDISMLRRLFKEYDKDFPMHFRDERDMRTIERLGHELGIDYSSAYAGKNKHDAEDDAIVQAKVVRIIINALRGNDSS